MYKEFYGFREKPFSIVPDPSFLYPSSKHRMALTYLEYGLTDEIGFILLTGEIGTGKTTLIRKLLSQTQEGRELAVINNTNVSPQELLELILDEFELDVPPGGKTKCLDTLHNFLIGKYSQNSHVLLVVDEAQNLSLEALEEIRMLSNLQTEKESLLQIILVGQPGLRTKLQHRSLAQLSQRIAVSYHLTPLDQQETGAYIDHRLKVARGQNDGLFAPDAIERVFQHSGGIPRTINILCDSALVFGYADELSVIDAKVIEQVVSDKKEVGLFSPNPMGKELPPFDDAPLGNGNMLHRLRSLEERMDKFASDLHCQIRESRRLARGDKDALIQKLERLLAGERRRSDKLLTQCIRLRERVNYLTNVLDKVRGRGR